MNRVELSLFIEANYPISGRGVPRKPVHGIGLNNAHYMTKPMLGGKQVEDPAYRAWVSMLTRAYSERYHKKQPTYVGVTVCKDWHSFSAFRNWWLENYSEGGHLDKDLLSVGNREYRPSACIYIPGWLNAFTTDSGASRGDLPIGVYLHKPTGMYQSHCGNHITGKNLNLGYFTTPEAAHEAWRRYKLSLADQLKPQMDAIDKRIYPNVVTIIKAAR